MPWKEETVENLREEFVQEVISCEKPKTALCAQYGISRVTGDKWLKRYQNGESLSNRCRAPLHTPSKTKEEFERAIIQVRVDHPAWGPRKIVRFLENAGLSGLPSPSTVCEILKRNGLVSKEASQASTPYKRFEKERPNELWQTDFKGHFAMSDGSRCHPLTTLDDHSRYALCVDAKHHERYADVVESFSRMFKDYGRPRALLCDNGNPWGTSQSTGYTRFELWLLLHDVLPIHCRPGRPQTQGKEERFNRTLKDEVLKHVIIRDLTHAQREFDRFRDCYNHLRPHEALKLDTPATRYTPYTNARMPCNTGEWEYPQGYQIRKIKKTGFITFGGQGYFLGEAFENLNVAIRESSSVQNCVNIYYRNFRVARVDVDERIFVSRKIYRTDEKD